MRQRVSAVRRIRQQRRHVTALTRLVESDRAWFDRNPQSMVRFRPERPGDFGVLRLQGVQPPVYVPPALDPMAPQLWVAVVEVMRAIGLPSAEGGLRCRIRTVPIRSRRLQAEMAEVFAIAVCRDVLGQLEAQPLNQSLSA
jgi:hypothetical protein